MSQLTQPLLQRRRVELQRINLQQPEKGHIVTSEQRKQNHKLH
jgi:hypothetical protein